MIDDLISRYKQRLLTLWDTPNPYYKNPLYEAAEINQWIKKLEKIKTNK